MAVVKRWMNEVRLVDGDCFRNHQAVAGFGIGQNQLPVRPHGNQQGKNRLLTPGSVLKSRWRIGDLIAEGGFGQIFMAFDQVNENTPVVVKADSVDSPLHMLKMEITVMKIIRSHCETQKVRFAHFLWLHDCGTERGSNFIVMDLCGPNLRELKKGTQDDRLSVGTSLRLACQMVRSLADLHQLGWLHRDVKPPNFCMGHGSANSRTVFLIDFGLSRQYRDAEGHRRPRFQCGFRGTIRYASINMHAEKDVGRFDDLWSLFYIILEQILGQLPWRRVTEQGRAMQMKQKLNTDDNFMLARCPSSLTAMRNYLKTLNFYTTPDYEALISQFKQDLKAIGVKENDPLDWENGYPRCAAGRAARLRHYRPDSPCPTIYEGAS